MRIEKIVTDIQKKWLTDIKNGKINKADNPRKYSAYMRRVQTRVDHLLVNFEWVADNCPDILKYEEREYDDPNVERHARLKRLLRICVKISPFTEDPSILKILGKMLPSQFGIELFKKQVLVAKSLTVYECNSCRIQFEPTEIKNGGCPNCGSKDYTLMD